GSDLIGITHQGIKEIEEAHSTPDQPTYHFPSYNYTITVGSMTNSNILQASPHAHQSLRVSQVTLDEVRSLVQDLKAAVEQIEISAADRAELRADVATIEAQLGAPSPKMAVLSECLSATRRILEGAASNMITPETVMGLIAGISYLLSRLGS